MSEKFAEETHQAKEFSRQSRNLREREKTSIKSRRTGTIDLRQYTHSLYLQWLHPSADDE